MRAVSIEKLQDINPVRFASPEGNPNLACTVPAAIETPPDREAVVENLRNLVLAEWEQFRQALGSDLLPSKEHLRQSHAAHRLELLERDRSWIAVHAHKLEGWFANGSDIVPAKISPSLVEVETREQQDLFRLARYTWSLPYSKGYGRRLRFLIVDNHNSKLIGLLGLQSPPLDFGPRDRRFSIPSERKVELVNQTIDVYVQGAVPPYSILLGGKLAVMAVAAQEVREAYQRRYMGKLSQMEHREHPAHLVAATTTSAFGRSSLYNRVVFEQNGLRHPVTESLGFMQGFGAFQFSNATYQLLKEFIRQELPGRKVTGFDTGPRIKWQVITLALQRLGIPAAYLHHGVPREAYLIRLVSNLEAYLGGEATEPQYRDWRFAELAAFWKQHYLLGPRRQRPPEWREWERQQVLQLVLPPDSAPTESTATPSK